MDTLRQTLIDLLSKCTTEQVEFFNRMYGSVEAIKDNDIPHAFRQIERTLEKNDVQPTNMKIINLQCENYKKIKAVDITPNDNTIIISGANGQGKSSILDSIFTALCGKDKETTKPIRDGQDQATIQVDLGDFIVIKTFKKDKQYLTVESKDGSVWKKPQSMLNDIIGKLSFDPLEFANKTEKEQRQILLELTGLNFDTLNSNREALYNERYEIGLKGKMLPQYTDEQKKEAKEYENEPKLDVIKLTDQYQNELNKTIKYENAQLRIRELESELEELKKVEKSLEDLEALKNRLDNANVINDNIRQSRTVLDNLQELEDMRINYDSYTDEIKKIDSSKKELLEQAKMPIEGLTITDDGVLYNEIPFNQISTSEKLKVSTAIVMTMNPKLKVIRIMDGSLLDNEGLKTIQSMVKEQDYQLWIEKVDDTGKVGFYIEDGEVKNN